MTRVQRDLVPLDVPYYHAFAMPRVGLFCRASSIISASMVVHDFLQAPPDSMSLHQ